MLRDRSHSAFVLGLAICSAATCFAAACEVQQRWDSPRTQQERERRRTRRRRPRSEEASRGSVAGEATQRSEGCAKVVRGESNCRSSSSSSSSDSGISSDDSRSADHTSAAVLHHWRFPSVPSPVFKFEDTNGERVKVGGCPVIVREGFLKGRRVFDCRVEGHPISHLTSFDQRTGVYSCIGESRYGEGEVPTHLRQALATHLTTGLSAQTCDEIQAIDLDVDNKARLLRQPGLDAIGRLGTASRW